MAASHPAQPVAIGIPQGLALRREAAVAAAHRLRDRAEELHFDAWRLHIHAEQHGVRWPSKWQATNAGPSAFVVRVPADVDAPGKLRAELRRFVADHALSDAALSDAQLALTEAAENAVLHAYPPGTTGSIEVQADIEDGVLEIVVLDSGRGAGPLPDGLGLGLSMIARLCDDFEIRAREPNGVEIWMRFVDGVS